MTLHIRPQELLPKLKRSLKTRGLVGTLTHYIVVLARLAKRITPAERRLRDYQRGQYSAFARKRDLIDLDYDTQHKLDTGGKIELEDLSIESETKEFGVFYQAVFPDRFRHWIDSLNIEPRDFLFVDIGAGKGRALFLAQDFGFKRVEGVEFAKELVDVCRQNIRVREADGLKRARVSILHMDALLYPFPGEPTVLFINNPFGETVMRQFVERLRQSLHHTPRPLKIVYGNPVCDRTLMFGIPNLRRMAKTERFNSYEWNVSDAL